MGKHGKKGFAISHIGGVPHGEETEKEDLS